jgi:hypothetical protein
MSGYRCYLMNGRIIEGSEALKAATDEQAVQAAEKVFRKKTMGRFSGFVVWLNRRYIYRYPPIG